MMEQSLRDLIEAIPDMTATVDWGSRPRKAPYPGIVLNIVSDGNGHTHDGPDGLGMAVVQIDVYGQTYAQAKIIARRIKSTLDGYSDDEISGIFIETMSDKNEEGEKSDERVYRNRLDFRVVYHS